MILLLVQVLLRVFVFVCLLGAIPLVWIVWLGLFWEVFGWHYLATKYKSDNPLDAEIHRWQTCKVGHVNCLMNIQVHDTGLRLWLPWLFSYSCEPILIPWSDLELLSKCNSGGKIHLRVGDPEIITIQIPYPLHGLLEKRIGSG